MIFAGSLFFFFRISVPISIAMKCNFLKKEKYEKRITWSERIKIFSFFYIIFATDLVSFIIKAKYFRFFFINWFSRLFIIPSTQNEIKSSKITVLFLMKCRWNTDILHHKYCFQASQKKTKKKKSRTKTNSPTTLVIVRFISLWISISFYDIHR